MTSTTESLNGMIDKTDALEALNKMRDASANAGTAQTSKGERAEWDRYDAAEKIVREALAAPTEAVGMIELEWLHDHLSRTLSSTQLDRAHAVLDSLAAQPAASVDVEGLREGLKKIAAEPHDPPYNSAQARQLERTKAEAVRLLALIDSAGGAKENNNGA